jgi:APA family basic amino acid/polyamine antiporter
VLRKKLPDAPRPYRTFGYPVVPAIFIAASVFIVGNTLVTDFDDAKLGLALVATGLPALAFLEWRKRKASRVTIRVAPEIR